MNRSIVLTGATGFLGAFLLAGLLERGYRVTVLGRAAGSISLAERLSQLVRWFGIVELAELPEAGGWRLRSFEVDLAANNLGLSSQDYKYLCASAGKIVHCASNTNFAERNRDRIMATNVNSLLPLLELASKAKSHVYYVGTAYAAGLCEGLCLEAPVSASSFTNVYEESKALAEAIIGSYCTDKGMPFSILRPSIVFGHSKTGSALKFNALYYPVKSLLHIRDIFAKDIAEQGGKRSAKWGICRDNDGTVHLPLAIHLRKGGVVNLVPVDYFVESALRIIEQPGSCGVYHITSNNPPDMATLIEYSERFLGLRGIRPVWNLPYKNSVDKNTAGKNATPNPAEELFDRLIMQYRPYLSDLRVFDRSRIQSITNGLAVPPFSYEMFERCMTYAVACDWGKNS